MLNIVPLSEQIENILREKILAGELVQGQKISIDEISARLGVSSTPVRDAVRRLESSGFLVVSPRKGVFVSGFDRHRFKNVLDIRIALECLAVEHAIINIPDEEINAAIACYEQGGLHFTENGDTSLLAKHDNLVHDMILQYSGNPMLIELMNGLQNLINWGHKIVAAFRPDALQRAFPEHLAILISLKTRDVQAAQDAVRAHLNATLARTFEMWPGNERSDQEKDFDE